MQFTFFDIAITLPSAVAGLLIARSYGRVKKTIEYIRLKVDLLPVAGQSNVEAYGIAIDVIMAKYLELDDEKKKMAKAVDDSIEVINGHKLEIERLRKENAELRTMLGIPPEGQEPKGNCPDCQQDDMKPKTSEHTEPHGEHVIEHWLECPSCGFQMGDMAK